ncbi:MAG: isoamylase early set domain-containing protein [Bacteroidota bacterium]
MSIIKKYLAKQDLCQVTFKLPPHLAESIKKASVVGEFNDWDPKANPMKKAKDGKFSLSLKLPVRNEYHFRYLLDGENWETDFEADGLSPVPWSNEFNSVLKL